MKKSLYRKLSWILAAVTIAIAVYFFSHTLYINWQSIREYDFRFNVYILPAVLLLNAAVWLTGLNWRRVLYQISGQRIGALQAIYIQAYAWLLKYLPGQAGLVLAKLMLLKGMPVTKKEILVSTVYENVFLVLASFSLGIPGLFLFFSSFVTGEINLLGFVAVCLLLLLVITPPIFYRLFNGALRLVRREPISPEMFLDAKQLISNYFLFFGPRLITGLGFVFLIATFAEVQLSMVPGLIVTYILSSIIGMLAFAVPGGLGVREGVMTLMLSQFYPLGVAVMLSLLARLVVTLADAVLFVINLLIKKQAL